MDGSGKCNAYYTGESSEGVIGVVYEIHASDKAALDSAEGLGSGYNEANVTVILNGQRTVREASGPGEHKRVDDRWKVKPID